MEDINMNGDDVYKRFVKKIEMVSQMHKEGHLYCDSRTIWQERRYNRNMVYYSPRIRSLVNENKKFETTYYDDIYFALIETYVEITGYVPQPYFRVNQMWLKILNNRLPGNIEKNKALCMLFLKCTTKNAEYVIKRLDDMIELKEYKILCM